ncbi:MAG TPA: extracellular solute-binding protein [Candidatus Dormibacteraeota bacterium]|nr:extracellular solute-binding protein [Candidatus Dormibacteraeota bacterium]
MAKALASLALATCLVAASPPQTVTVLYAGSLVTPMEGPIAQALARQDITFEGEGRGSQEIANFITAGLRNPDVVIVVDPAIMARLARAGLIAQSWTLGGATLGIALAKHHPPSIRFDEANVPFSTQLLDGSGMRIARTDPRLDPKGRYTIEAVRMLVGARGERQLFGADENPAQIFPEQDLLVRLETGEADWGVVYSTEARARHLEFIPFPGRASMSDEIRYVVAVMKGAPHPKAARAFVEFLLHGTGRRILEAAGLAKHA